MSSENPRTRFTALIDTCNHERFIAEAIESVLAQDFPASEMEILVVDDGSTDRTPEIIRGYGDRVRHIRKENGGQASALNLGFAEARGEVIAMLDGDDVWVPRKIRRVMEALEQHPEAGIVFHPYQYWYPEENRCGDDVSFVSVSGFLPDQRDALLLFGGVGTCSTAIRREHAKRVLPIPEELVVLADAYFIAVSLFVAPVVAIPECLTKYRHHGANLTAGASGNEARQRRAFECSCTARRAAQSWLEQHGFHRGHSGVDTLLERMRLVVERLEFGIVPPGRRTFFAHLQANHRLYAPLWTPQHRAFDSAKCLAGFLLGFQGYHAFQDRWRNAVTRVRGRAIPVPVLRTIPS